MLGRLHLADRGVLEHRDISLFYYEEPHRGLLALGFFELQFAGKHALLLEDLGKRRGDVVSEKCGP